ncbi:MAG TPA: hypothetical protein VGL34_16375 [Steroidobacteraceae bacterium]
MDFPLAAVGRAKTTSLTEVICVLPQLIWTSGLGRITTLVLVSPGAMVVAIVGFGNIPIQNRNGSKPCMILALGHSEAEPNAAGAAKPVRGKDVTTIADKATNDAIKAPTAGLRIFQSFSAGTFD